MNKKVLLLTGIVLMGSGIAIGLKLGNFRRSSAKITPTQIIATPTVEKIVEVAKLVSIEYYMSEVVDYQDKHVWPFSDEKILIIAKAKILAGVDLSEHTKVFIQEVSNPQNQAGQENLTTVTPLRKSQIIITLPQPKIIAVDPTYKYYDIQGNPPIEAHTYALNLAKVTLRQAALREGILEKAKTSIVKQLQQFFPAFDVSVQFGELTNTPLPVEETSNVQEIEKLQP